MTSSDAESHVADDDDVYYDHINGACTNNGMMMIYLSHRIIQLGIGGIDQRNGCKDNDDNSASCLLIF